MLPLRSNDDATATLGKWPYIGGVAAHTTGSRSADMVSLIALPRRGCSAEPRVALRASGGTCIFHRPTPDLVAGGLEVGAEAAGEEVLSAVGLGADQLGQDGDVGDAGDVGEL